MASVSSSLRSPGSFLAGFGAWWLLLPCLRSLLTAGPAQSSVEEEDFRVGWLITEGWFSEVEGGSPLSKRVLSEASVSEIRRRLVFAVCQKVLSASAGGYLIYCWMFRRSVCLR